MAKNVWVFCEQRDGEIQSVAIELLGVARELADKVNEKVVALLLGHNVADKAKDLVAYGADEVRVVDDSRLNYFTTEYYAQAVTQVVKANDPNVVLFGATSIGRDLAPRLSARLHTGLTADCTKLEMDEEGNLFMTRPAFGGNLFATIICPEHRPQMSTVRPGVMKKPEYNTEHQGEIIMETVDFDDSKAEKVLISGEYGISYDGEYLTLSPLNEASDPMTAFMQENGYDTFISEDGGQLSQGQKQLLCITRIMLMQPPMLSAATSRRLLIMPDRMQTISLR